MAAHRRIEYRDRIRRLRGWLDRIAYASLVADIAIAVVTLVYINTHADKVLSLELTLNYVLTAIVIVSVAVLVAIAAFSLHIRLLTRKDRSAARWKRALG
ncbi:MAG: hypothetical protein ACREBW_00745 [Candidatus Micrarchaeaceae archaeon]